MEDIRNVHAVLRRDVLKSDNFKDSDDRIVLKLVCFDIVIFINRSIRQCRGNEIQTHIKSVYEMFAKSYSFPVSAVETACVCDSCVQPTNIHVPL